MKINNLEVGRIYKNYKELCSALEIKPKSGNSKINQMKNIESWVELTKKGHSLKVDRVFDRQQPIKDARGLNPNSHNNKRVTNYHNFLVPVEHWDSKGVYLITYKSRFYIGSTIVSFRERFMRYRGNRATNPWTYNALTSGGSFEVIEVCDDDSDFVIREKEEEWIKTCSMVYKKQIVNKDFVTRKIGRWSSEGK